MRLIAMSCSAPLNRSYLIRSGKAALVVDALTWALDALPVDSFVSSEPIVRSLSASGRLLSSAAAPAPTVKPGSHKKAGKAGTQPAATPAVTLPQSDNASCVAAVLQCLWLLLRHTPSALDVPIVASLKRCVAIVTLFVSLRVIRFSNSSPSLSLQVHRRSWYH